jgi:hypothetical protein
MSTLYGLKTLTVEVVRDAMGAAQWIRLAAVEIIDRNGIAEDGSKETADDVLAAIVRKVAAQSAVLALFYRDGDPDPVALTLTEIWGDFFGTQFAVESLGWSRVQGTVEEVGDVLGFAESIARKVGVKKLRSLTRRDPAVYGRWIGKHGFKPVPQIYVFEKDLQ